MIHTEAGYHTSVALPPGDLGSSFAHLWYLKDHLGNNRVFANESGNVLAAYDYDPFGVDISVLSSGFPPFPTFPSPQGSPYKYGGKEWNTTTSTYDFEARQMSPSFHRFTTMDPLAEKYYGVSPYAYCVDNPILFVDPDGRDGYVGNNGEYKWFDDNSSQGSFTDKFDIEWTWITSDRNAWDEAITIRNANIEALVSLGNDREKVSRDVRLYSGDHPLFTKESRLMQYQEYISEWGKSINSEGAESAAWSSGRIGSSGYELKFYLQKGGDVNAHSLGLVKSSLLGHFFEASLEMTERMVFGRKADNDPLFDMHVNNAKGFLRWKQ